MKIVPVKMDDESFSTLRCGSWIDATKRSETAIAYIQSFSTLRCGSWIDAGDAPAARCREHVVSVPFDAGRGLMH